MDDTVNTSISEYVYVAPKFAKGKRNTPAASNN